ncbi:hypothetical protein CP533_0280 [Ophiocordyceps camponoti-saundersi (nom. inval.)]|nr:hypothetical protein CP533_0280 [Ophiocordyceps camponoti-saundersi (nom. inval.)]
MPAAAASSSRPPPAWLFSNNQDNRRKADTNESAVDAKMVKGNRSKGKKPKRGGDDGHDKEKPTENLLDMIDRFLAAHSYDETLRVFRKQRVRKQPNKDLVPRESDGQSLEGLYIFWEAARCQAKDELVAAEMDVDMLTNRSSKHDDSESESSSSGGGDSEGESSSESGSDSDSEGESTTSSDSSSDSESESESESDSGNNDQARQLLPKPASSALKRKKASVGSSSSIVSSGSSSDSRDLPPTKKQKVSSKAGVSTVSDHVDSSTSSSASDSEMKMEIQVLADASSSDSSSDPSSDSDSESESDSEAELAVAAKLPLPDSEDLSSSDSSSTSSSDSDSDSDESSESDGDAEAQMAAEMPLPESDSASSSASSSSVSDSESPSIDARPRAEQKRAKTSTDSSETLGHGSPKQKTISNPPLPPDPYFLQASQPKGQRFSRIPKNVQVDAKFASNEYVAMDYSRRAYEDLVVTKGKNFTKEKNKKKKGSFRGGAIDIHAKKGVYFDD